MMLPFALAVLGVQAGEIFKSEEGRFQAWYPSPPVYQKKADESDPRWDKHKHRVTADERDLMVMYNDVAEAEDLDAFAKKLRKNYVDMQWKVLKEARITLGTHKGLTFTLSNADGTFIQQRLFFVKNRLYQVLATTTKADQSHPDVVKFLASFKPLETK